MIAVKPHGMKKEIWGRFASVPSGAAALRWRRNCPFYPAALKHPNTQMMSQIKVVQVTAGAKGPPMVFVGAAQLESEK